MMGYELFIALRYLRARQKEKFISIISFFALIGITLGVAVLIIVMSVMDGFREEFSSKILKFNSHIMLSMRSHNIGDILPKIEKAPNVKNVILTFENQAILSFDNRSTGVLVKGMGINDFNQKSLPGKSIISGNFSPTPRTKDQNFIAIGARLAEAKGIEVGEGVSIISPDGNHTPFGKVPRHKTFTVNAIYEVGMKQFDENYVFMPLETARIFFNASSKPPKIEIFLKNPDNIEEVIDYLYKEINMPFSYLTWKKAHSSMFEALVIERNVMFLILTLIILIAAFNIISSLVMMVTDKTKEISILRAMGATRFSIMRIFMYVGSVLGIGGSLVGGFLGIIITKNLNSIQKFLESLTGMEFFSQEIYYLATLPAQLSYQDALKVILLAMLVSFLATLYPALKASRLNPIWGIKND